MWYVCVFYEYLGQVWKRQFFDKSYLSYAPLCTMKLLNFWFPGDNFRKKSQIKVRFSGSQWGLSVMRDRSFSVYVTRDCQEIWPWKREATPRVIRDWYDILNVIREKNIFFKSLCENVKALKYKCDRGKGTPIETPDMAITE